MRTSLRPAHWILLPVLLGAWLPRVALSQPDDSYQIDFCVIENGGLTTVMAVVDVETGTKTYDVGGATVVVLEQERPPGDPPYAGSSSWYAANEAILVKGVSYVKYGLPRIIGPYELLPFAEYENVLLFVEAEQRGVPDPDLLYVPIYPGCEFQPYVSELIPDDDLDAEDEFDDYDDEDDWEW